MIVLTNTNCSSNKNEYIACPHVIYLQMTYDSSWYGLFKEKNK